MYNKNRYYKKEGMYIKVFVGSEYLFDVIVPAICHRLLADCRRLRSRVAAALAWQGALSSSPFFVRKEDNNHHATYNL